MSDRPGGALAKRPLQFIWIIDCSGSMQGKKIETLNYAIKESIKPMQDVADGNPNAEILLRVIKFSDSAQWQIAQPVTIHNFKWIDLNADGETCMGKALTMVADALKMENMPPRGLPPVLVLVSDGQPTDDFDDAMKALLDQPWGKKSIRIAVAIGEDADLEILQRFIGNPEVQPLVASNVQDLVKKIKWASTVPIKVASNPANPTNEPANPGGIPGPPPVTAPQTAKDVF